MPYNFVADSFHTKIEAESNYGLRNTGEQATQGCYSLMCPWP